MDFEDERDESQPASPASPGVGVPVEVGVVEDDSLAEEEDGEDEPAYGQGQSLLALREKVDLHVLQELMLDERFEACYRRYLMSMYYMINRYGFHEVQYRRPRGTKPSRNGKYVGWRLYADGGLQNAPAALRRLVLGPSHVELDIRNSVPFWLYWLASSLGVESESALKPLCDFVERREEVLEQVKGVLGVEDNDLVKGCMLKLVHGGRALDLPGERRVDSSELQVLAPFRDSVRKAAQGVAKFFPRLWEWCEKNKRGTTPDGKYRLFQTLGRFVHFVTTRFENEIMMRVARFFGEDNVSVLVHDAVYVKHEGQVDLEALQAHLESEGPLSAVQTSKADCKTILIDGVRIPVPVLVPPDMRARWRVTVCEERPGDREVLYARVLPSDRFGGYLNVILYTKEGDLFKVVFADESTRFFVHPISFEKHRVQIVNAVTGLGKTEAAFGAIRALLAQKPTARVVWVVGRISQAQDSNRRLPLSLREHGLSTQVVLYEDASRQEIYNARILLIQLESLWKLFSQQTTKATARQLRVPDLVVLDEAMLIFNQSICMETNGPRLRENDNVLRALCAEAPRLLIMDKDIHRSPHLRDFLLADGAGVCRKNGAATEEEAQQEIQLHHYSYVPPHLRRKLLVLAEGDDFVGKIIDAIRQGKKLFVSCHTQKAAAWLYDLLHKHFPDLAPRRPGSAGTAPHVRTLVNPVRRERTQLENETVARENLARATWSKGAHIMLLDGETSKSTAAQLTQQINEFFRAPGPRCLIHTSRVCVAVDLQTQIDFVFLHCSYNGKVSVLGPPARILSQMLMRPRNVLDNTIYAFFGEKGLPVPRSYPATRKDPALPWEHGALFNQLEKDYSDKERRRLALYRQTGRPNQWSVIEKCHSMVSVVDANGERGLVEVPSSLKLRLLASLVEQRQSLGVLIWDWLVKEYEVVLPPILSDEERERIKADEKRKQEEQEARDEKKGPPPEPTRRGLIIRDYIKWLELTPESVNEWLVRIKDKQRPTGDEKDVWKILLVLAKFPGELGDFRSLRQKLDEQVRKSRKKLRKEEEGSPEADKIKNDIAWRTHKWIKKVDERIKECKKAIAKVDNMALSRVHEKRALQSDLSSTREIPVVCESNLAMHKALNGFASILGVPSMNALTENKGVSYPLSLLNGQEQLLGQLSQQVRDASKGLGQSNGNRLRGDGKVKSTAKYILGQVGYTLLETGKRERVRVNGAQTRAYTFKIVPKDEKLVKRKRKHIDFHGAQDVNGRLMNSSSSSSSSSTDGVQQHKRQRTEGQGLRVTADADV